MIDTYNHAADDADRALNLVDYYADKEDAAIDAKRKKRYAAKSAAADARHDFYMGRMSGIDIALSIAGYTLIINDDDRAVDIVEDDAL